MRFKEFTAYKRLFRSAIREILVRSKPGSFDEAAFPAYSHRNPLINILFWERIRKVITFLETASPYGMVMDFGCGSGVLLPLLSKLSTRVVAIDTDLSPLEQMKGYVTFPTNITFHDPAQFDLAGSAPASFDVIVALDVLEHVEDLENTISSLCRLLKQNGKIVVSGPSENLIYKMGRFFAGPEYTGDYHQRDIYQIKKVLSGKVKVRNIATLYFPFPLFEIFYGEA